MADRVDSVHIKIKIDVDEESKEFAENLSQAMARTDEIKIKKEVEIVEKPKKKKKEEFIGPPTKTQAELERVQKLLDEIQKKKKLKKEKRTPEQVLKDEKLELVAKQNKEFNEGPVGQIHRLSTQATSNLMKMATNPGAFFISGLTKIFGKYGGAAARGGIYALIALLVYETTLFAIRQLMEPGRWLDRRYRRIARVETMNFYERTLQEELRHGYIEMRVTTMQGLRGGASQVSGNYFEFSSGPVGILQSGKYRSSQQVSGNAYLSGSGIDNRGNPKRTTISGRFG